MRKKQFFSRKQKEQKALALQRIKELFSQADKTKEQKLKNRYAALAYKLVQKYKVKLPRNLKRKFCKKCRSYWTPGKSVRVRIAKKTISYTCLVCGKIRRLVK